MSARTLSCDQAIFTSIPRPTGEGYRIIAASRGLRPDEKQTITRNSPSHDALCGASPKGKGMGPAFGAAFYALPSERLCVAYTCFAGAEHTGRGGQRVYTHNVVFEEAGLALCGYNPFVVLRAMEEAKLTSPQLRPPAILPDLQLPITDSALETVRVAMSPALGPGWRGHVLHRLLGEASLIVNVADKWAESAEALLLGLPGPMRAGVSFSAGLRFSVGRSHRLCLLFDDHGVVKSRIAGRPLEFIEPGAAAAPQVPVSAWVSFVERHWAGGDIASLARRTSQPFADVTPEGWERVGGLYNELDAVPDTDTARLISNAPEHLDEPSDSVEAQIVAQLREAAQRTLIDRLGSTAWREVQRFFPAICDLWKKSEAGCRFAQPLMEKALESAGREHPRVAAEAALALTGEVPAAGEKERTALLDRVLKRLADWAQRASDADVEALRPLCEQWQAVRPDCPIVERIHERCNAVSVGGPPTP